MAGTRCVTDPGSVLLKGEKRGHTNGNCNRSHAWASLAHIQLELRSPSLSLCVTKGLGLVLPKRLRRRGHASLFPHGGTEGSCLERS